MKLVAQHFKDTGKVINLRRIRLWTDGHPSTYKGFPNFGRMGHWPLRMPDPSEEGNVAEVSLSLGSSEPIGITVNDQLIITFFDSQLQRKLALNAQVSSHSLPPEEAAVVDAPTDSPQSPATVTTDASTAASRALSQMKVQELRAALSSLGLDSAGLRVELIAESCD
jgi:hypothetical protein